MKTHFHRRAFGRILHRVGHEILHNSFHLLFVGAYTLARNFADFQFYVFALGKRTNLFHNFAEKHARIVQKFVCAFLFELLMRRLHERDDHVVHLLRFCKISAG